MIRGAVNIPYITVKDYEEPDAIKIIDEYLSTFKK
jgi:hypothetical protein